MEKIMQKKFDKEKQKLESEVENAMKRTTWMKDLRCEVEKFKKYLSEEETAFHELQNEIACLKHLLQENNCDRDALIKEINRCEIIRSYCGSGLFDPDNLNEIKNRFEVEKMKSLVLNNDVSELNYKHTALKKEFNNLENNYLEVKCKCVKLNVKLKKKARNSKVEELMEELKDSNISLRNNLDCVRNQIRELQATKTDLINQLVNFKLTALNSISQFRATYKINQPAQEILWEYKWEHSNTCTNCEKYILQHLIQEKNKVALELEATKIQLIQMEHEDETKKFNFDEVLQELTNIINVIYKYDCNANISRFLDKYYNEVEELQNKIQDLEKKSQYLQLQWREKNKISFARAKKYCDRFGVILTIQHFNRRNNTRAKRYFG